MIAFRNDLISALEDDTGPSFDDSSLATTPLDGGNTVAPTGNTVTPAQPSDTGGFFNNALGSLLSTIDGSNTTGAVGATGPGGVGGFGTTPSPQDTYTPPPGASYVGRDASGNPLYQLQDDVGDILQWGVDKAGGILDNVITNISQRDKLGRWAPMPTFTPRAASAPAATQASSPAAQSSFLDTLSNMLTGNNAPTDGNGVTIAPVTKNAPITTTTTTLTSDNSTRASGSYNTTNNLSSNVNSPEIFNTFANSLTQLFRQIVPQSAANAQPFNDASQSRGMSYPGNYAAGQSIATGISQPTSANPVVATVKNFGQSLTQSSNLQSRLLLIGIIIAVVGLGYMIFRRK